MDDNELINQRLHKLEELEASLNDIDDKLLLITKELNWDYKKLLEEDISNMVTCSINNQHRIPISKVEIHEQKCSLHHQGYSTSDKFFPEHSGSGSFVTLTPQSLQLITKNVSSPGEKCLREVPQTSANFDQNFDREEKLAIYDYVIANTQKQKTYSDLWLQPVERTEEKREMAAWEIAAAERDAKRRRASYRNKVHTNRKTHTEILREVIEAQMEAFKLEVQEGITEKIEKDNSRHAKSSHHPRESSDKRRRHEHSSSRDKEEREKRRERDKHSKHREHKRSPSCTGNDKKSRSRSHDKYRKWKSYEGRSHSHRSKRKRRMWQAVVQKRVLYPVQKTCSAVSTCSEEQSPDVIHGEKQSSADG